MRTQEETKQINTEAEKRRKMVNPFPVPKGVPSKVRNSVFGCMNCLWSCIECKEGSKYSPRVAHTGSPSCKSYTCYD